MHAPSQHLEQVLWTSCSIPVHLADPHRGVSAQNRGFTTLQRMLWASPRREASPPEQVLFGVLHRGPLKGLLWADSGQSSRSKWLCKISVLRVPAYEAVIVGLQKEPLSPSLPPPPQPYTAKPPLHCASAHSPRMRRSAALSHASVRDVSGASAAATVLAGTGDGLRGCCACHGPSVQSERVIEESVASRLEEHIYEDSLESLSLDK